MSWVWDHSEASGIDRLVLLAVADHASDDGTNAYPAMSTLQKKTRVDERTVQRALRRLVDIGELAVRFGAGEHGQNVYRVIMNKITTPAERHPRQSATPGNPPPRQSATGGGGTESPTPRQSATQTVLEPSLEPKDSPPASRRGIDALFDEFWSVYPRREAKSAAKVKFAAAVKRGVSFDVILIGAKRYRDDPNREPQYTAHPATWLNQGRWDDDPLPPRAQQRSQPARNSTDVDWSMVGGA